MAKDEWSVVSETPVGAADDSGWGVVSETPIAPAVAPAPTQQMTPQQMERFVKPAQPQQTLAPKPELDRSFSPLEEAKKGAVGAATVGIPSSVEQFKLAGGAEALQGSIQQLQLLDKIDKGQITSPVSYPTTHKYVCILPLTQRCEADCVRQSTAT